MIGKCQIGKCLNWPLSNWQMTELAALDQLPPAQMPPRRFPVAFCRSPQMPAGTIAGPPIAGRLQNGHFQSHMYT